MRSFLDAVFALLLATASAAPALAEAPSIMLTVNSVAFDRARLEQLPQASFVTSTPWTTGTSRFEGPLLRDVLAAAGASGTTLTAVALNDYKIAIPFADAARHGVIVAVRRNGEHMRVRDKGPLWIVYPLDSDRDLQTPEIHARMIWQLKSIVVE